MTLDDIGRHKQLDSPSVRLVLHRPQGFYSDSGAINDALARQMPRTFSVWKNGKLAQGRRSRVKWEMISAEYCADRTKGSPGCAFRKELRVQLQKALFGALLMIVVSNAPADSVRLDQQVRRNKTPLAATKGVVLSYADVVDEVRDSVVTVEVQVRRDAAGNKEKAPDIDDFDIRPPSAPADDEDKDEDKADGNGSGVVLTADGLILTNNHVIEHAETVRIRPRGSETAFIAEIIGRDPYTDVALLRVEEKRQWSTATFGDSSLVRVGDVALALGTPLGLDQTLTCGVISATGRSHLGVMASGMEDFIQTDAAINPGNSGGPLMDARGRVIGINTAKYWADNIGFSVPVNLALKIASDLAENGRVVRGYLGVRIVPLNRSVNKVMGLRAGMKGVAVDEVKAGSPAAEGGLLPEDVVVQINQLRIDSRPRFFLALAMLRPGDTAVFNVMRKGVVTPLKIKLGMPPEFAKGTQPVTRELAVGLAVAELDEVLRTRFNMPPNMEGLVVMQDFGSKDGVPLIRAGEIIVSVNGEPMLLVIDLPDQKLLSGKSVMLKIRGKPGERLLSVTGR